MKSFYDLLLGDEVRGVHHSTRQSFLGPDRKESEQTRVTRIHPDVSEFFGGFSGRFTFSLILEPPSEKSAVRYGKAHQTGQNQEPLHLQTIL